MENHQELILHARLCRGVPCRLFFFVKESASANFRGGVFVQNRLDHNETPTLTILHPPCAQYYTYLEILLYHNNNALSLAKRSSDMKDPRADF